MNVLPSLRLGTRWALGLLVALLACARESDMSRIQRLEGEFREAFTRSGAGFDSPEIQQKALQLTQAYEAFAAANPDDSASARFLSHAADLYEHTLVDLNKTISALDRVMAQFPHSGFAEQALFRKAYIYHNVLRDLPRAKDLYEGFLAKYPGSTLVQSAKFELDNLGVPEPDLLNRLPIPVEGAKNGS